MKTLARSTDKAEILRRLQNLRLDSPRRWGRMTAHQTVCHLADANRVALGQMSVSMYTPWWSRTLVKWVALRVPLPWPSGIPTRPELDQASGAGTRPAEFAGDVAELVALVERMTEPGAVEEGHAHSFFGKLSRAEWLRWGYLHMDHHLRQFGM